MTRVGKKRWHTWIPRPLREHLRARELEWVVIALSDEYASKLESHSPNLHPEIVAEWSWHAGWPEAELGKIRTTKLVRRAKRRGIDLYANQDWWTDHMETQTKFLTKIGLAQAKRLIRDDFRQSVKWWVEVVGQVAMALAGLGGIAIGILSVLNSN